MLGQFPDLHTVNQVEIQMFTHSLKHLMSLTPSAAHDTSCGSCGIKSDILSFSLWWKRKHPTILNCIIVSYKINYFICLNTVTLLFSSDLLLPSVCITVIFSTPTLCMLKCQNPASIIPVISLLLLMGWRVKHHCSSDFSGRFLVSLCRVYMSSGKYSVAEFCFGFCHLKFSTYGMTQYFHCSVCLVSIMTDAAVKHNFGRYPHHPNLMEVDLLFLIE